MGNDLMDDLDRRLRAARPATAEPDWDAFDADLLARVREQPVASRRTVPRAIAAPVAAGATLTAAAAVILAGGPGDVGGPSSAAAITQQTLRWLSPPPHTVLHTRAVETRTGTRVTHEYWQSADHPEQARELESGAGEPTTESSGDAFYDATTNTIYDPQDGTGKPPFGGPPADDRIGATDPMVFKVRTLLREGEMAVGGHTESIDGVDAWKITLKPGEGRAPWSMWVDAENGKPIEVSDPSDGGQVIRWSVYEVLPDSQAAVLTTLAGAHPSAHVVQDPAEVAAAQQRLFPDKSTGVKDTRPAGEGPKKH
jgi:hypothetical protein